MSGNRLGARGWRRAPKRPRQPAAAAITALLLAAAPRPAMPDERTAGAEAARPATAGATLRVLSARLTAQGSLVHVRYSLSGRRHVSLDPGDTYVIEETSRERFPVLGVPRIGRLGPQRLRGSTSYFIVENGHRGIAKGASLTVVVDGLRQAHVPVEE